MTDSRTSEARLDAMLASLRQVEPALDDLTRARVGVEVQAALREEGKETGTGTGTGRRMLVVGGVMLAVAAAAGVIVVGSGALSGGGRDTRQVGGGSSQGSEGAGEEHAADARAVPGVGSAVHVGGAASTRVLTAGQAIDVRAGAAERVAIGDAEVTVYGPGRVASGGANASASGAVVVDADAVLVDRARGDGTLALAYGDLEVRVTRATFALDRTVAPRVTVMRGDLLLRCEADERVVHAGESATCTPTSTASAAADTRDTATPDPSTAAAPAARTAATSDAPSAAATREPATHEPAAPTTGAPPDAYAEADRAMRRGDRPGARIALEALVAAQPGSRDAAAALLDLARLDAAHDAAAARRHLDALDAHAHGAVLAEPSAHLRCTLFAADERAGRIACLAAYYRRFPDSPRAAAVLARLAVLHAATDCATALPLLREYLARFDGGPDRAAVVAWRDRCATPTPAR